MHFSTTTILATLGLATIASAAPTLEARDCSAFPWFIAPYPDSSSCNGKPATYQPTSGPYTANPVSTGCRKLWNPSGPPASFLSVSINRDACPQQKWQINLYTDAACGTKPTIVTSDICVPSLGTNAAGRWESFEAIPLK